MTKTSSEQVALPAGASGQVGAESGSMPTHAGRLFPENYFSARLYKLPDPPGAKSPLAPPPKGRMGRGKVSAPAVLGPTGTVLDEWLPILTTADQEFQVRQYLDAASSYQELVDRINDVDPDVWNSLTPDQQQQALQYLVRGHFGLADSHSAFGDYEAAENDYSTVMFDLPSFLSADRLAYVFLQWSTLYLDWGNALFRADSVADALTQYTKLIKPDDTLPARSDGGLYGFPSLQPSMDSAAKIAQNISQLIAGLQTANSLGVNPLLAAAFLEAHQQLVKIGNSLDFWGHFHNTVPIWTFDYLQGAAGNFAQFAVNAERDFISFQERSDAGSAMRQQLAQLASQASAEVDAARGAGGGCRG